MPPRKRTTQIAGEGKSLLSRDTHNEVRPAHRIAGGTKFGGKAEQSSRNRRDDDAVPGFMFLRG